MDSDQSPNSPIERLRRDLSRPAGGWTIGFLTMIGMCAALFVPPVTNIHHWATLPIGVLFFIAHVGWASNGYYPRRF